MTWGELPAPGDDVPEAASTLLDTGAPSAARIYDRWLGGKDNFGADRQVAHEVAQAARARRGPSPVGPVPARCARSGRGLRECRTSAT